MHPGSVTVVIPLLCCAVRTGNNIPLASEIRIPVPEGIGSHLHPRRVLSVGPDFQDSICNCRPENSLAIRINTADRQAGDDVFFRNCSICHGYNMPGLQVEGLKDMEVNLNLVGVPIGDISCLFV